METVNIPSESQKLVPPPVSSEKSIEFSVIGTNGDTKYYWDKTKPVEVEAARETFKKLRKEGYFAYKLNPKDDSKGEALTEFDPDAGSITFTPPLRGG